VEAPKRALPESSDNNVDATPSADNEAPESSGNAEQGSPKRARVEDVVDESEEAAVGFGGPASVDAGNVGREEEPAVGDDVVDEPISTAAEPEKESEAAPVDAPVSSDMLIDAPTPEGTTTIPETADGVSSSSSSSSSESEVDEGEEV